MATATIPDTRTTPPVIIEYDISALEQRVNDAWAAYQQKAEPLGIDFGKACSELREKGEVVQGGTTFSRRLLELSIPRSTACWWIDRYETLIGVKEPKPFVESPVDFSRAEALSRFGFKDEEIGWITKWANDRLAEMKNLTEVECAA